VTEEEDEEDPAPHEQDRGTFLDGPERCRIAGQTGREGFPGADARRHDPDDQPGQNPSDDDGDEDSPGEKPSVRPWRHALQDSALMMALSTLVIDSKRASPRMTRSAEVMSISALSMCDMR